MTEQSKSAPRRPALVVHTAETPIDVRHWARFYVAVLLELEGVSVTPHAIADAS